MKNRNLALTAGILACAALMLPASATAAPSDMTQLTVTGNVAGHKLTAYKLGVFDNVTIDGTVAEATVSSVDDTTRRAIEAAARTAGITIASGQDPLDAVARADAAKTHAFVNALSKTSSLKPAATVTGSGSTASLQVSEGWYLITDSMGLPMLVGTTIKSGSQTATSLGDTPLGRLVVKNTSVSVDKKVNDEDNDSVSVGSTVTYTVTATLPAREHLTSYQFRDTLTGGRYTGAVTATIDGGTVSVTPRFDSGKTSFTIDLTNVLRDTETTIELTYRAVTTAETTTNDAVVSGVDRYGDALTPGKDTSTVTTHDFTVTKVSSLNADTRLDGARFKIRRTNGGWLKYDTSTRMWSDAANEQDASTFTTGTAGDGTVEFPGLGTGSYTVKETQAPDGYTLDDGVEFTAAIGDDGHVTFSGDAAQSGDTNGIVKNMPTLGELARTGVDVGTGSRIAVGIAAICATIACAAAYAAHRRDTAQ